MARHCDNCKPDLCLFAGGSGGGGGSSVLVADMDQDGTLNKTFAEIAAAMPLVSIRFQQDERTSNYYWVGAIGYGDEENAYYVSAADGAISLYCGSESEFPSVSYNPGGGGGES